MPRNTYNIKWKNEIDQTYAKQLYPLCFWFCLLLLTGGAAAAACCCVVETNNVSLNCVAFCDLLFLLPFYFVGIPHFIDCTVHKMLSNNVRTAGSLCLWTLCEPCTPILLITVEANDRAKRTKIYLYWITVAQTCFTSGACTWYFYTDRSTKQKNKKK